MAKLVFILLEAVDQALPAILLPLCVWILLSGLDDLLLDFISLGRWLGTWWRRERNSDVPTPEQLREIPERPIAIMVPCWQEHAVIRHMIEHNAAAIAYRNYHFFAGAYPNDPRTISAVTELERRLAHVHLAVCPHEGPTSKADCLNWIYQHIILYERRHGQTFDAIVTHDAEDVVHPQGLHWINYLLQRHGMVQLPVLPIATPLWELTHGVYMDEFCESQTRDMPLRQFCGSFVPSNGVGAGFARNALEQLAEKEQNRIFEPTSLTEDYETGIRLHRLGARQMFVPLTQRLGSWIATREYFPRTFSAAVRQRTRWVMGISLQAWERHQWGGSLLERYWFWRDRKGLVGSPLSFLTNALFFYGLLSWTICKACGTFWSLGEALSAEPYRSLLLCTAVFGSWRAAVRIVCSARIAGWRFACLAPIRTVHANTINSLAVVFALLQYADARLRDKPLRWFKTSHQYPGAGALQSLRRPLAEVLVGSGFLTQTAMEEALASKPAEMPLEVHLLVSGVLTEELLYEAVSLYSSLPLARVDACEVPRIIARSLPASVLENWRVLPVRVEGGGLRIASPEIPSEQMQAELQRYTSLEIRFQLITPSNYAELAAVFNP